MTVAAIIIAIVAAFLAFKFITGIVKLIVLGLIVAALAFFVLNGVTA